jgi:hypothetical protein
MYSRRRRTFRWHSEAFFLRHFAAAIEKNVIAAEAGWDIIT